MKRLLGVLVLAGIGCFGAIAGVRFYRGFQRSQRWSGDAADAMSLPRSVEQLVNVSDVIFEGTVTNLDYIGVQQFSPVLPTWVTTSTPSSNATETNAPGISLPHLDIALTEISIRVNQIYFARPPIEVATGDYLTMLVKDNPATYLTPTPATPDHWTSGNLMRSTLVMPTSDETRLFFLTRNPDGTTYGPVFGPYCVMDLSGNEVRIQTSAPLVIDITDNTDPTDFIDELEDLIQGQ